MMWRALSGVLALALALVAVPAWHHFRELPPTPVPVMRSALAAPPGAELGAGDDVLDAAISPDGRSVIFVATSDGIPRLWRQAFDADRPSPLADTAGAGLPAWKPSGDAVAFFSEGWLRSVAVDGGEAARLIETPAPAGVTWLRDDSLLVAPTGRGPIRRLAGSVATDATQLSPGDVAHVLPSAVGGDGDFLYVAVTGTGQREVRLVWKHQERSLGRTSGHAEIVGNHLVHVADGALTAQPFDPVTGSLSGRPVRLAFDVGISATGRALFAASPRVLIWAASAPRARSLTWFDLSGVRTGTLSEPGDYWQVRLSPDDRQAAVTMLDPLLRTLDVFVIAVDASEASRKVSLSLSADTDPVWSPRGDRIAFRSMQGGQPNILARPPGFSERADEVVLQSALDETPTDWRLDTLLFHAPGDQAGLDLWVADLPIGNRRKIAGGAFNEFDARWSPDGRWIAYVSDETGQSDIFARRWPNGERPIRVTQAGGTRPRWTRDGLVFLRGGAVMRAAPTSRGDAPFTPAERVMALPEVRDYSPAHLSNRLLAIVPAEGARASSARIIANWTSVEP